MPCTLGSHHSKSNATLLAIFVLCFFAFWWFVVIKFNMKTEEIDTASSCAVEPELSKLKQGFQRKAQNFPNRKSCSKRNSKKVDKHVRKNGGYKSRVSFDSVPMIQQED
ncbi:hypothetical protein [Candidatus Enterovibrio altilux]|uniref:hypothetical protein n=1 Tax=Candidatus Enterovibrio altilux TaxID=1927128 RepID=UPI0016801E6A|nr:hypothetical protein [Candidatus Enterovibrio luxaltus]